jgi:hypothetical protein
LSGSASTHSSLAFVHGNGIHTVGKQSKGFSTLSFLSGGWHHKPSSWLTCPPKNRRLQTHHSLTTSPPSAPGGRPSQWFQDTVYKVNDSQAHRKNKRSMIFSSVLRLDPQANARAPQDDNPALIVLVGFLVYMTSFLCITYDMCWA